MSLFSLLPIISAILFSRSGSFTVTVHGTKLSVAIADEGTAAPVTGFSFGAAAAIAGTIFAGAPGVFSVRVGKDVYAITIARSV